MEPRSHLILIGDTILNRTYHARPFNSHVVPFSFLNEEYLELIEGPDPVGRDNASVQGIGYIARQLADCRPAPQVTVWTDVGTSADGVELRGFFERHCTTDSRFGLGCRGTRVVLRILRDVSLARLNRAAEFRPQLRLDSPLRGAATRIDELLEQQPGPGFTLALVRASSPEFFAHPWSRRRIPTAEDLKSVADRVQAIQRWLQQGHIRAVIDLRPIPPGFQAIAPDTVVCTTIGRLRDYLGDSRQPMDDPAGVGRIVIECFWRFGPLEAIVCYAGRFGTIVCRRGAHHGDALVEMITTPAPATDRSDLGMITGGDAFVVGLLDGLRPDSDSGGDPTAAACQAHLCLDQALGVPLGRPIDMSKVTPEIVRGLRATIAAPRPVANPRLSLLNRVVTTIEARRDTTMSIPGLVSLQGGRTAEALAGLTRALADWAPEKGKDLISVFGESRSGKEYALTRTLAASGYFSVGPVNMHQFLGETGAIIRTLRSELDRLLAAKKIDPSSPYPARRVALLIDEIQPGDAARPLLNLLAEKQYTWYARRGMRVDFVDHPIFLMSSIDESFLLDDLQGRLFTRVRIPPLRERLEELPYLLHLSISNALGKGVPPQRVRISLRCLEGLLAHDYLPRVGKGLEPGLDQRNFRALDDIIREVIHRAETHGRADAGGIRLHAEDLPRLLLDLVDSATPEDQYLEYPIDYKTGDYPVIHPRG